MIRVPKSLEKSCDIYADIWSNKNELRADQVSLNCNKKFWFDCSKCCHEYYQSPNNKTNGKGCSYCSNKKLCGNIKCLYCLPKSCYIYKDIWSSMNRSEAHQVSISNGKKFFFNCIECNHDYQQTPSDKTNNNNRCPYCSKYTGMLCENINCIFCLPKSCFRYKNTWSSKNDKSPEKVSISNGKKFWFNCNNCNHEYTQSPNHKSKGVSCPYCSNNKICGNINCLFCLPKSCNVYSNIWSQKNNIQANMVSISSCKKYWFDCLYCSHDYYQKPHNKTNGNGCPFCKNKTEKKVADFLKEINVNFKKEFKIHNNKRYDFYLLDFNLIIEVDGIQHFKQVSNWQSCEDTIENDIQKMKIAIENGYSILRIYQPDIYNDTFDWKQYIKVNLHSRKTPTICYQASVAGIYERHLKIYSSIV